MKAKDPPSSSQAAPPAWCGPTRARGLAVVNVSKRAVPPPDPSPQEPPKARRRPWPQRILYLVAGLLSIVVLVASVGGFVVVKWFDGSISRVHLTLGASRPAD